MMGRNSIRYHYTSRTISYRYCSDSWFLCLEYLRLYFPLVTTKVSSIAAFLRCLKKIYYRCMNNVFPLWVWGACSCWLVILWKPREHRRTELSKVAWKPLGIVYQKTNSTPVYLLMEMASRLRTELRGTCVNVFWLRRWMFLGEGRGRSLVVKDLLRKVSYDIQPTWFWNWVQRVFFWFQKNICINNSKLQMLIMTEVGPDSLG